MNVVIPNQSKYQLLKLVVSLFVTYALLLVMTGCASTNPHADFTETINGTAIEFDMVWIEEGNFWIGRTEVTWDEYLVYCDFEETDVLPEGVDAVSRPSKPILPYDRDWGAGKRPAVGMSWNAAKQYCQWLSQTTDHSYRLPTEEEWELACGNSGFTPISAYAWFVGNSNEMTHEVGQKEPNRHGLYDMLGNLWEYCANPYSPDELDRAVLRGGSWKDQSSEITPTSRLGFEYDWILADPNVPPGVWWVPEGEHLGLRVLRYED